MDTIFNAGIISDDSVFAAELSSYFVQDRKYFPVFSLPRLARPDWELEVSKRATSINRIHLDVLFCKPDDYAMLAPFRDQVNADIAAIDAPQDISRYLSHAAPNTSLIITRDEYLSGLIKAWTEKKFLEITHANTSGLPLQNPRTPNLETVVVLEKANRITDISAINYAFAKGYDLRLIEPIPPSILEEIEVLFKGIDGNGATLNRLRELCKELIDFEWIEDTYQQVLFVVSEIPIGLFIESIPAAHLPHLQSDLRIADEWYYLNLNVSHNQIVPSLLFVDTENEDIISEIPEICQDLNENEYWGFHLNGESATIINFLLYSQYFPYDLLLVSGHGRSPYCRNVVYRFNARDGKSHTMQFLEYYQFGRTKGELVAVDTKLYPLQVDGIEWENKQALAEAGIDHMFRDFLIQKRESMIDVVEADDVHPKSIEGLSLADGVFMGTIRKFASNNNPIMIFNTCGSLLEMRGLLAFAGPRALIGTMWSVYDGDAYRFATTIFEDISNSSISRAFHKARSEVECKFSRLSYVHFGTLNSYLPMNSKIGAEAESGNAMARRLIAGFIEAASDCLSKKIDSTIDLQDIIKLKDLSETYVSKKFPTNNELRQELNTAQRLIQSG